MNEEKKNNGRGIFYGVIGVATLVVAIIGATFAYFTATGTDNGTITGNMATITFHLSVSKVTNVDETKGGMIPMSNHMVHQAVSNASTKGICVDDNGNAVCQIYRIDVENTGSASLFVDGYVTLTGGSGTPTDVPVSPEQGYTGPTWTNLSSNQTSMRWAQVFCTETGETLTSCSTGGNSTVNADAAVAITALSGTTGTSSTEDERHARTDILTDFSDVTGTAAFAGNSQNVISKNYIRISDHAANAGYDREVDPTSAIVYNQYLTPASVSATASAKIYFVVWLSETGTDQTAGSEGAGAFENANGLSFFSGKVTFNSAQGSEVTATFSSYAAVQSDQVNP